MIAGLCRAEESAGIAELGRLAETLGRDRRSPGRDRLLLGDPALLRGRLEIAVQPLRPKWSRQEKVDRHVRSRDRARDTAKERRQAGSGARRQVKTHQRHFDRSRRDVDDAAELATHHRINRLLNELYRHDHVGGQACGDLFAGQFTEIAGGRSGIVVDEDVRFRRGSKQRQLSFRGPDIGDNRRHLRTGLAP